MEKLIDGKLYDTEQAERIATWRNTICKMENSPGPGYCREELYRTDNESWFIYGSGGAKSKYSETTADDRTGGEDIRAVTEEEALLWCMRRGVAGEARERAPGLFESS